MKKLIIIFWILSFGPVPIRAINLLEGNRELGVIGQVDADTFDGTLIEFHLSYGYFWADFIELGIRTGFADSDVTTLWNIGAFTEYHFFDNSPLVPFVGASVDVAGAEFTFPGGKNSDESAVVVGVDAGAKYFLTDRVAVSGQFGFDVATDDVFASDDSAEQTNWDFELGMRFFF